MIYFIITGLALFAIFCYIQSKEEPSHDIKVPEAKDRPLLFGYYGVKEGQLAETEDHVNLLWFTFWRGESGMVNDLKESRLPCCIDVSTSILSEAKKGETRRLLESAELRLRGLFDTLKANGVLGQVRYLTPTDEPNLRDDGTSELLPQAVGLIRSVASEYPELDGVKMACIYFGGGRKPMPHCALFDVVGTDDYEARSSFLSPEEGYDQMRAQLRPDQRTLLVPGGSYGQDPTPFRNFANAHPEVEMVIPFTWATLDWEPDFKGIADQPEVRAQYRDAGMRIKAAG